MQMRPFDLIMTVLWGILLVLWIYRLVQYIQAGHKEENAKQWPETTGRITNVKARRMYIIGKRGKHYLAIFNYSYTLFGIEYNGKFKIDSQTNPKTVAFNHVVGHPIGSTLPVSYNPEKYQECFTEDDKLKEESWPIVFLIIIFAAEILWRIFPLRL
jgi:hypothetical protein